MFGNDSLTLLKMCKNSKCLFYMLYLVLLSFVRDVFVVFNWTMAYVNQNKKLNKKNIIKASEATYN